VPAKPQHAKPQRDAAERAGQRDRNGVQAWPNDKPKPIELPDCWECSAEKLRPTPCLKYGIAAKRST